ncbi:HTH-type transcriptional repressor CarH [Anaeromyxobacter paludicola]|uniref:HTH-type transcriptional repressor CarH n=1 Tax=Anaeromyxobacter paludicola TaxID=2918171 RepID=A0ABM7XF24_9BACT|nr:HTH-type transcriptional repressor CarH [Anaeromyxobacter paludicola]
MTPERDERGRLYSDDHVRKLRLLRMLVERGHSIGRLSRLDERALSDLATSSGAAAVAPPAPERPGSGWRTVADAVERFDAAAADRELRRVAAIYRPRELVHEVMLPLMRWVGDAWYAGRLTVAQEHLTSALLHGVAGTLVGAARETPVRLLFATPPGERHELGLLAAAALAAAGGLAPVYLGAELPAAEVAAAAARSGARAAVVAATGVADPALAIAEIGELRRLLPGGVEVLTGGARDPRFGAALRDAGATQVPDLERFEQDLARHGARF